MTRKKPGKPEAADASASKSVAAKATSPEPDNKLADPHIDYSKGAAELRGEGFVEHDPATRKPRGPMKHDDPKVDYSAGGAYLRGEQYRPPEYLEYLEKATNVMRTVRLIVYAGMAAFILLAFYGFYLIYNLTYDVHRAVDKMEVMTQQMQSMANAMANMDASVAGLRTTVADMQTSVGTMTTSVANLDGSVAQMQATVTSIDGRIGVISSDFRQLSNTVALMQHSASNLDQSIGPAMGTFNRMIPFGWGSAYPGAPPYAPPIR